MNLKFSAALYLLVSALLSLGALHAKTPDTLKNFQVPELIKKNDRMIHAGFSSAHSPELLDHSPLAARPPKRPQLSQPSAPTVRPKRKNSTNINFNVGSTGNRSPPPSFG